MAPDSRTTLREVLWPQQVDMVCSAPCCSILSAFGAVFLMCISAMFAREPEYVMEGITTTATRASAQCWQAGTCCWEARRRATRAPPQPLLAAPFSGRSPPPPEFPDPPPPPAARPTRACPCARSLDVCSLFHAINRDVVQKLAKPRARNGSEGAREDADASNWGKWWRCGGHAAEHVAQVHWVQQHVLSGTF